MGNGMKKNKRAPQQKIRLHKRVLDKFQSGSLTNIIAAGHQMYHVGSILLVNSNDPKDHQHAHVHSVHHKTLASLTEEDVEGTGLTSVGQCIETLKKLSPELGGLKGMKGGPSTPITVCSLWVG